MDAVTEINTVLHIVQISVIGLVSWYLKKIMTRQMDLTERTHTELTALKAEHDTYKSLGGCPLMTLANGRVENG